MGTVGWGKSDHVRIVAEVARGMKCAGALGTYCEIGVLRGACFNQVAPMARRAIAVDCNPLARKFIEGNRNLEWFSGASREFWRQMNCEKLDMTFIDGSHHANEAYNDAVNAIERTVPGGFVLMHDVFPPDDAHHAFNLCGDVYKVLPDLRKRSDIELCVFPFYYGVAVIRKLR